MASGAFGGLQEGAGARLVLTTAPDAATAERIARALVDERLCACATVLPGATSIYRWQGAVESASECQLVVKCSEAVLERLVARLAALHPYELSECVVLEPRQVESRYAAWILEQCDPAP
ncbi:MAG: periplasmic divalent cation tolerance protein CutA [Planctomycetota bacterium]|jgi:periplasmic divalent cation tolerance protein